MTTMRHRFDKDNKDKNEEETPEERAARLERLLNASAEWEPERDAPDDLVARAAARIERERNASWWNRLRYAQSWWSVSAMGLTVAAATVFVVARLTSGPEQAVLYIPRSSDAPRMWQVQASRMPVEGENSHYQTVALMPEGFARPVMSMPTMSPSGYTTQLAPSEDFTIAVTFGEPSEARKPSASFRRNPLIANRAEKLERKPSLFAPQRNLPKRSSGPKGKEVDELALPPVWQEETVTRQDYRVAVPVMLTPNDADASNPTGIPAVVELTFEQPTVPLRSTFDE
jgi:hypothetical protein